jgi:hypothetical protein
MADFDWKGWNDLIDEMTRLIHSSLLENGAKGMKSTIGVAMMRAVDFYKQNKEKGKNN